MALRKRGLLFKSASERVGIQKEGVPSKKGASNPGENYEVFAEFSKLGRSFLYCSDRSNS